MTDTLRARSDEEAISLSYYSVADLGHRVSGSLHFPGRKALPVGSVGYVRSSARAQVAAHVRLGKQVVDAELPWRDYPPEVLTPSAEVLETPFRDDYLLLGCRNVLNEWGYQVRLDGTWWRRAGDSPVDERWPVLTTTSDEVRFLRAREAEQSGADLLTGVPLAIDGTPSDANFLIANNSDVAHVFEVHPKGLLGPSPDAWFELSNRWEALRSEGLSAAESAASLLAIARNHRVSTNCQLLHSLIAQTRDGRMMAFALTGALPQIAEHLVKRWEVANAILLDNGGSVGWFYCPKDRARATLLLAGPNRRENGTAFLSLRTRGFPQTKMLFPC